MRTQKGLGKPAMAVILVVGLLVGAAAVSYFGVPGEQDTASVTDVEAEGEIDTLQPVQEATGFNDLSVTEQDLNTTGLVDDGNVEAKTNLSGTNGDSHLFAAGIEVDGSGGVEDVDVDVTVDNATGFELRGFWISQDAENVDYDERTQAHTDLTSEINDDADEIDTTLDRIESEEHVIVAELKAIDTDALRADEDIVSVDLDGDTDDSDDNSELHYTVDNLN